mmetsp:Transcript_40077/g.103733  ORF Transcript_40077/g.103733 Transcript_40077/m.103733 type:complete len:525 (+) Transcript_40077:6304-7878(+)
MDRKGLRDAGVQGELDLGRLVPVVVTDPETQTEEGVSVVPVPVCALQVVIVRNDETGGGHEFSHEALVGIDRDHWGSVLVQEEVVNADGLLVVLGHEVVELHLVLGLADGRVRVGLVGVGRPELRHDDGHDAVGRGLLLAGTGGQEGLREMALVGKGVGRGELRDTAVRNVPQFERSRVVDEALEVLGQFGRHIEGAEELPLVHVLGRQVVHGDVQAREHEAGNLVQEVHLDRVVHVGGREVVGHGVGRAVDDEIEFELHAEGVGPVVDHLPRPDGFSVDVDQRVSVPIEIVHRSLHVDLLLCGEVHGLNAGHHELGICVLHSDRLSRKDFRHVSLVLVEEPLVVHVRGTDLVDLHLGHDGRDVGSLEHHLLVLSALVIKVQMSELLLSGGETGSVSDHGASHLNVVDGIRVRNLGDQTALDGRVVGKKSSQLLAPHRIFFVESRVVRDAVHLGLPLHVVSFLALVHVEPEATVRHPVPAEKRKELSARERLGIDAHGSYQHPVIFPLRKIHGTDVAATDGLLP